MKTKQETRPSTSERILSATLRLMSEKGYRSVTVKQIAAEAGFSEMTVFRTFGSKKAILDRLIENYLYNPPAEKTIRDRLTYDLETDLLMLSEFYHETVAATEQIYLLSVMERSVMPDLHVNIHNNATKFTDIVADYLRTMQEQGKAVKGDPFVQAATLMYFNYGKFATYTMLPRADRLKNLQAAVAVIARGLAV
ncbi:hypothetical protein B9G55_12895 [Saccharibacillus sp. O16]|nr:hypothetical protein B9G55_12895 [Saccharibacillus sp. O16]